MNPESAVCPIFFRQNENKPRANLQRQISPPPSVTSARETQRKAQARYRVYYGVGPLQIQASDVWSYPNPGGARSK